MLFNGSHHLPTLFHFFPLCFFFSESMGNSGRSGFEGVDSLPCPWIPSRLDNPQPLVDSVPEASLWPREAVKNGEMAALCVAGNRAAPLEAAPLLSPVKSVVKSDSKAFRSSRPFRRVSDRGTSDDPAVGIREGPCDDRPVYLFSGGQMVFPPYYGELASDDEWYDYDFNGNESD